MGALFLSPGSWCTQCFVCALQGSVSAVLWKFCNQIPLASKVKCPGGSQSLCRIPTLGYLWLYGGANGNLLQGGLCHTLCDPGLLQPEPLSPWQATADLCFHRRQTLKGRSDSASVGSLGPRAHKGLFEPSKHLWQVWDLILNGTSSLLQSCWDFLLGLHTGDRQMVSTGVILF